MDRLRRPESFDDVRAEGLFRGTTAPQILQSQGIVFTQGLPGLLGAGGFRPDKIPTKEDVLEAGARIFDRSSCADHVDVFVSHCWGSKRWAKYLALCLYLNLAPAVVCALTIWVVASTVILTSARDIGASDRGSLLLLLVLVYFPTAVFFFVFFMGHHLVHRLWPTSLWVDRVCVSQTDDELKRQQIQALPVFVARSSSMLVLWDDSYFQRLWCQLELATFAKYGGAPKVHFLPLWMAPWLMSAIVVDLCVATTWFVIYYWVTPGTSCDVCAALVPQFVLESPAGPFFTGPVGTNAAGMMALGLLASAPWTYSCKKKLRNHALMLEQMASFDCREAQCTLDADRTLVELHVRQLFGPTDKEEAATSPFEVAPAASHRSEPSSARSIASAVSIPSVTNFACSDARSLDAFNAYIRGPLQAAVVENVGGELHVSYSMCLLAALPMIMFSVADIVQYCGTSVDAAEFASCAVPGYIVWIASMFLVLPITYPVFLRMLKCTLAVRWEWLQLVLAVISGTLSFCYMANLTTVLFLFAFLWQEPAVYWAPFLIGFLAFLLWQIRCLFRSSGGSGISPRPAPALESGSDATYRQLHVEDD